MASTLLTAGILLGITFLFIFLFSLLHKKGKNKALANRNAKFNALVAKNNLTIKEREEFEQYQIAIDTTNLKLLYLNFTATTEDVKVIDLQKIKTAKVDIEENSIYENRKGKSVFVEKHILKLQLAITSKDANQPIDLLTFYQYQDGMADFNKLKKRIEYWKDNINNFIKV
jgi:hypothetical protein